MPFTDLKWPGDTAIVSCFFNPHNYKQNQRNLKRYVEVMGHPVQFAELSFNGTYLTEGISLWGTEKNIMWQKERLLNIAISQLPDRYTKVAWIDADVQFLNCNWLQEASERLEECDVIQPFSQVLYSDSEGGIMGRRPSWMKQFVNNGKTTAMESIPGMAWAARREVLSDGLFDRQIIGGGDTIMAASWTRLSQINPSRVNTQPFRCYLQQYRDEQKQKVQSVGYLKGDLVHFYHGTRKNRFYCERDALLNHNEYDPQRDIQIDQQGLFEWATPKSRLHGGLKNYFAARKEDQQIPSEDKMVRQLF